MKLMVIGFTAYVSLSGILAGAADAATVKAAKSVISTALPVVGKLMADAAEAGTLISVNSPELAPEELKGIRKVPAAPYGYGEDFVFTEEESGLWQIYPVPAFTDDEMRYDWDWYHKGYVTVSQISYAL